MHHNLSAFIAISLIVVALVGLSVGVYARNLDDYFLADDFDLINSFYGQPPGYFFELLYNNESSTVWQSIGLGSQFGTGYLRPVKIWLLKLDLVLWGANPVGFHLTSTALFALNVVLTFLILDLLIPDRRLLSVLAATALAVHPVLAEIVPFITAREEIMATGFGLCSLYAFLRYRLRGGPRFFFYLFYGLALFSKESAIGVIALPLGWDLVEGHLRRWDRQAILARVRLYGPPAAIIAVYLVLRWIAFGGPLGGDGATEFASVQAFLQFHRTFFIFLVGPMMLSSHGIPYVGGLLLGLVLLMLGAVWVRRDRLPSACVRRLVFAGPIWYVSATAISYGSYFTPRHNVMAIVGLIVFGVLLLDGFARAMDIRRIQWAAPVLIGLAAWAFLPPTLELSRRYDNASRVVEEMRIRIERETADLPEGSVVHLVNVPQWGYPPWYFGYGLQSALKKPFTASDLANRSLVINERNIAMNEYDIEIPERFDLELKFVGPEPTAN